MKRWVVVGGYFCKTASISKEIKDFKKTFKANQLFIVKLLDNLFRVVKQDII